MRSLQIASFLGLRPGVFLDGTGVFDIARHYRCIRMTTALSIC
jgi:hypothetical protein